MCIYFDSSSCVRVKRCESKQFMINSAVRQERVMSRCLFNVYMDGVMKR